MTGLGQRLDPGGNIDAITAKVVADNDHIGEVQAEAHVLRGGPRHSPDRAAHLHGGAKRVHGTGEFREDRIASRIEDPALKARDDLSYDRHAIDDARDGLFLVLLHRRRRGDKIADQNGSQLPLHLRCSLHAQESANDSMAVREAPNPAG